MKLTTKQLYDMNQLIKREWCNKPRKSCENCIIGGCRVGIWWSNRSGIEPAVPLGDEEIKKAKKLLEQHGNTIAEEILLGDNV